MAASDGAAGTGRQEDGAGQVADAAPWFALVAALVLGGLLLSARAGDAYTHLAGLLFAAFGLLFGARLLHRLLP